MGDSERLSAADPDPRIIDALKRRPATPFGQLHGPDIADAVVDASRGQGPDSLTERIVTEDAVRNLARILKLGE